MFDCHPVVRFPVATILLALGACAAPSRPASDAVSTGAVRPAGRPVGQYEVIASDVTVKVYRDGPLAELGHNHVVATTAVSGRIELRDPAIASSFSLSLPLAALVVDDAGRRVAAGPDFPDDLSPADKEGTRRNMLGPALLDAARHPVLHLDSVVIDDTGDGFSVTATTRVAGVEGRVTVPVKLERTAGQLILSGEFVLAHADLGLKPFSTALGALRVREDMEVSYRLVAREDAT